MIGAALGSYRIVEEIGRGGMAVVYRAKQPSIGRDVAIKVIMKGITGDPSAVQRFQREARLIARLEHAHILPVYDFDGSHEPPYIVMRYLDGGTLQEVLEQGDLLPLDEVVFLMRQISAALDYAHRQGIVHRDVKPSNILIDREGNAFVMDFGIARITDLDGRKAITATGATMGTPDYMSPEQALAESDVDAGTDVYALGVMLFQMLTGQLPFIGTSSIQVVLQHIQKPPPLISTFREGLPPGLDAVLLKAMAKERAERYTSTLELFNAFSAALEGISPSTVPSRLREAAQQNLARSAGKAADTEAQAGPTEQNKSVVALCANVSEYAALVGEIAGAESSRRAMTALWKAFEQTIVDGGGALLTQSDHDLLALWGVESAHEDDAEQAVRTALQMQADLRQLGAAFFSDDNDPLPLDIGIHSGLVLLTNSRKTSTYRASGSTISLANRLMQESEGMILISHEVFKQILGVFDIQAHTTIKIRGRKDPFMTYQVLTAKARAFRFQARGVEGIETRMVGRETEFKQLQNAFMSMIEDSETQVITLVSEAGVGKSRLLYEFRRWSDLRPEQFRIFHGRATSAMQERPYALIRDLISVRFEILDSDPLPVIQAKLEAGIQELIGQNDEIAHLIGQLCGFDLSGSTYIRGIINDPQQLSQRARQLFIRFFVQLSQTVPVVVLLEDIHYADNASLDLLNELFAEDENLPLMIVCTTRPILFERRASWGSGQALHQQLVLIPLSRRESRELAQEILQRVAELPKALRDVLVERAEGNPYFMEELVKMLIDDRVIVKESDAVWRVEIERLGALNMPTTLFGLLESRLDTLLYPEKLTLQRAAVFGKVFFDSVLQAMNAADDVHVIDLPGVLAKLVQREFIQRREMSSFQGCIEYTFAGNMLRETLLQALLERQVRVYNGVSGSWLEEKAGDRVAEYAPQIAAYYENAGELLHAAQILFQASERATQILSLRDAVGLSTHALELLDRQPDHSDSVAYLRLSLLTSIGSAHIDLGQFADAQAVLTTALELSREIDHVVKQIEIRILLGTLADHTGDFALAETYLGAAEALVQRSDNAALQANVLVNRGIHESKVSRYESALEYLHRGKILAEQVGNDQLLIRALAQIALSSMGAFMRLDQSEMYYKEALSLARKTRNRKLQLLITINLGDNYRLIGDIPSAMQLTHEALSIARESGSRVGESVALGNLGLMALVDHDWDTAEEHFRGFAQISLEAGATANLIASIASFAQLYAMQGDTDKALALIGVTQAHPAADFNTFNNINNEILPILRQILPEETIQAGIEAGKLLDFDTMLDTLLDGTASDRR